MKEKRKYNVLTAGYCIIACLVVLLPLYFLRENYFFTIHDNLDSWPSLLQVLKTNGLLYTLNKPMPILNGMPVNYVYFDFGFFRFLNAFFSYPEAEALNRTFAVVCGFFCMRKLFHYWFSDRFPSRIYALAAISYAISPVYPVWESSFAVLPLVMYGFFLFLKEPERKISYWLLLYALFGFFVYFPCVGIFCIGIYALGFLFSLWKNRRINKSVAIALLLMTVSSVMTNLNLFFYTLQGAPTNRGLMGYNVVHSSLFTAIWNYKSVLLHGQYHAPVVTGPLTAVCGLILFFILCRCLYVIAKGNTPDFMTKELGESVLLGITILLLTALHCLFKWGYFNWVGEIITLLKGFNLGRVLYFYNVFSYLFILSIAYLLQKYFFRKNWPVYAMCFLMLLFTIGYGGPYEPYADTLKNIFHLRTEAIDSEMTFSQFFDVNYFQDLKEKLCYSGEGVVSVGLEPAVAMYNGFNTLDGYISTHPMEYQIKFREIIAPELERNAELREYYDTWGGRMYVWAESGTVILSKSKDNPPENLWIDVDAFAALGGRYILSRYRIKNADEIGLEEYLDFDLPESTYHLLVYVPSDRKST